MKILAAIALLFTLSACNTAAGFGQDVRNLGYTIQKNVEKVNSPECEKYKTCNH